MMNGYEKSDSVIVAAKPANKAAHSAVEQSTVELAAAEPVEPRAETKGNADQQSTCRAQSRISVSQALERIRKVARERKKERFTALFHHISIDLLEEAFYELKEDAAPGVDRLTWTDYEADLEPFTGWWRKPVEHRFPEIGGVPFLAPEGRAISTGAHYRTSVHARVERP